MAARHRVAIGLAILIWVIGLLAPLTPSHGCPSASSLAIFSGIPAALAAFVAASARSRVACIACVGLACSIAFLPGLLLFAIGC